VGNISTHHHLCAHLVDKYTVSRPEAERISYVRDALVLGASYYVCDDPQSAACR